MSRGARHQEARPKGDPVTGKTPAAIAESCAERLMTTDNRPSEIPAVWPGQIATALALFRAAVLDETVEDAIRPLSDRGIWKAFLETEAMQRGIGIIRTHFESHN